MTSPWRQNLRTERSRVDETGATALGTLLWGGNMRAIRTLITVLFVGSIASAGAALPTAAQQQGTRCTFEVVVSLSPGLSQQPSSGPYHTGGETGTIKCVDGRSGTFGSDGRYGTKEPVTCTSGGEGWGVSSFTMNNVNVKDSATIKFAGMSQGTTSGKFEGERLSGSYTYTPIDGDCFNKPLTKGTVRAEAILKD